MLFASSTVITPSLPTFCIALEIILPISLSPFADIVPTWAISSLSFTFFAEEISFSLTWSTADSIPRLTSMGFIPAVTYLQPSFTIAWANIVAVVVPSPASSFVLLATSLTIWAPIFSNLSSRSISLATETPSFVVRGAPYALSITTFLPLGPRVTFTVFASISTPFNIDALASESNLTIFAILLSLINIIF